MFGTCFLQNFSKFSQTPTKFKTVLSSQYWRQVFTVADDGAWAVTCQATEGAPPLLRIWQVALRSELKKLIEP